MQIYLFFLRTKEESKQPVHILWINPSIQDHIPFTQDMKCRCNHHQCRITKLIPCLMLIHILINMTEAERGMIKIYNIPELYQVKLHSDIIYFCRYKTQIIDILSRSKKIFRFEINLYF